jgi:hypothetical protein
VAETETETETKLCAGPQRVTIFGRYALAMELQATDGQWRTGGASPVARTFLGSASAPDGERVRRRLGEIEEASRKRKSMAAYAMIGLGLAALVFVNTA